MKNLRSSSGSKRPGLPPSCPSPLPPCGEKLGLVIPIRRRAGYTLMELMVGTGLLVLLGAGLAAFLRQAIDIWHTAETRGQAYERGRVLLELIAEDLRSTVVYSDADGTREWIRFIADAGVEGGQRLRFVRTIGGEMSDPLLRYGGQYLTVRGDAFYDGWKDVSEARDGVLAPPSGMMEVLYQLDPRPEEHRLWRAVRAPIGEAGTLFVDDNIDPPPPPTSRSTTKKSARKEPPSKRTRGRPGDQEPPPELPNFYLDRLGSSVGEDVLYLGFRFWTPHTTTWADKPVSARGRGQESGPSHYWDSTRALLDVSRVEPYWRRHSDSLSDFSDDVFPELVEVTLVIANRHGPLGLRLADDMGEKDQEFQVTDPIEPPPEGEKLYLLVEREWVAVQSVNGRTLRVAPKGRGARWTRAARHIRGSRVEEGVTLRRVVPLPSFRSELRVSDSASRRRGTR